MNVAGKVIAITGAGGALGLALVEAFVAEGAAAVVAGDVSSERVEAVKTRFASSSTTVSAVRVDVRRPEEMHAMTRQAVEGHGRLDVMVNNAGVLSPNGRLHNLTLTDWQSAIDVNLIGTVNGIVAAFGVMRAAGGGAIINTASAAGLAAWAYTGPYGATKAAVIQLTRIASAEYARDKITVNCVCPGTFPSAIHRDLDDDALQAIGERHPMGLGTAEDIVGAYVYLASDAARWTTGLALAVDGGYTAL